MATYPVFVVNFTTHKDGDVVAAADPNTIQAEVTAIETTLGAMPHVSTSNSSSGVYQNTATTRASVSARLQNIEQGIVSDAHTQYVHLTGGDTISPQAGTVGLTVKAPPSPSTPIFQVTNNAGTPVFYVDSALVPRLVSGGAVVDTSSAQTLTSKTLTTPVIAQIVNTGTLTLPTATDTLVGRTTTDTLTNKTLTTPTIAQIVNSGTLTLPTATDTLVGRTTTDTLTNKTLTTPVIAQIVNSGTLTLPTATDTLVGRATTDVLTNKTLTTPTIAQILNGAGTLTLPSTNDVLVGRATTDTLTNKTLTTPVISSISNGGTITVPSGTDTLVGRATTDTLTNKTLTTPAISAISNGGTITIPSGTDTLVGRNTTDTLTNKTLTTPAISAISNGGTVTVPSGTDTLVGRTSTDTMSNKTLSSPVINSPSVSNGTFSSPTLSSPTVSGALSGPSWSVDGSGNITSADFVTGGVSIGRGFVTVALTATNSGTTSSTTAATWFSGVFPVINLRRYMIIADAESANWSGTGASGDTEALAFIAVNQSAGTAVSWSATPFKWVGLTRGGNNSVPQIIGIFQANATGNITLQYQFAKGNGGSTTIGMVAQAGRPGSMSLIDLSNA